MNKTISMFLNCALLLGACAGDDDVGTAGPAPLGSQDEATAEALSDAYQLGWVANAAASAAPADKPSGRGLARAMAALGGAERLRALATVEYQAEGERFFAGEGFFPGMNVLNSNHYQIGAKLDLRNDRSHQDIVRRQAHFGQPGQHLAFAVTLTPDAGQVDGSESIFGSPTDLLVPSGVGAARRELALLNPEQVLARIARGEATATELPAVRLQNDWYVPVVVNDDVQPLRLYVHQRTGLIAALSTMESIQLQRDTVTTAVYAWATADARGGLVPIPVVAALRTGADWILWEHRGDVIENPALSDTVFAVTHGAPADAAASRLGALEREYHQGFVSLGLLRIDADQVQVAATEVAPGVIALGGGTHNSMLIEQAHGLVLVEAPLNEARSLAIIAYANQRFPGKPFTHVVVTHHHVDHSGGVRTFVAQGAKVVLSATSRRFFEDVFAARSTVVPDALATAAPRSPAIVSVEGAVELADAERPVRVLPVASGHASDMVAAYLPNQQVLFQSDLWDPGFPPVSTEQGTWERQLYQFIRQFTPGAQTVVSGHGVVSPVSELAASTGN